MWPSPRSSSSAICCGRLLQLARKLKRHRNGQFAERALFRLFERDPGVSPNCGGKAAIQPQMRYVVQFPGTLNFSMNDPRASHGDMRTISVYRHNEGVPKVTFLPENKTLEFESGKLPYDHHGKPSRSSMSL